jgi:hypothetical protein
MPCVPVGMWSGQKLGLVWKGAVHISIGKVRLKSPLADSEDGA